MRAISALPILALAAALPAAGASAVTTASARIVSPTTARVELPASLSMASNGTVTEALRVSVDRPAAFSFGVRFDQSDIGAIEAPRVAITSTGGGLITTQDLEISLRETAVADGDAIRPASAAHLLVTCHTN